MNAIDTYNILGAPVANVDMQEATGIAESAILDDQHIHIGVVNAAKIVNMKKDPELRQAVLASDVIFADGISVVWAGRFLGYPIKERVAGIDLMFALLDRANSAGHSVYLLGARQDVVATVAEKIDADYPGVNIVGSRNGYFDDAEEQQIAEEIAKCGPNILFVAMTSPKKENFLARWSSVIGANVYHGVGGSFDVYAGKVARAPEKWQRLGLEWLYRLVQEPRRMWKRYLYTNTVFCWMLAKERLFGRSAERHVDE